jgi:cellulose synthase/poly-beta-1,6-N-acetylglucosamine synthase-like glycosyltransferase
VIFVVSAVALFVGFVFLCAAHRWLFSIAYLARRERLHALPLARSQASFGVVVPAHNEELVLASCLESISRADYPPEKVHAIVVADNCEDATAEIARRHGAVVYERSDLENPGKGRALTWLFERLDLSPFGAVAVVDADNLVDAQFFAAMNAHIEHGARVLQGYDGISNPDESTLTRLVAVTIVMKNLLYNAGRTALGLSPLLMGTGMVFSRDALEEHGWAADTIGEDLEETFRLLEAGERIVFVPTAEVQAQETATLGQGFSQRQRWASGRANLRGLARNALRNGVAQHNLPLIDAGLNLLSPTYSKLMNLSVIALALSLLVFAYAPALAALALIAIALQFAEFALGLVLMRANARFVLSILYAPVFLVWKAVIDVLAAAGFRSGVWSRTRRHRDL